MYDQEREEMDHNIGRMTEHQNAFALSTLEADLTNDQAKIDDLVKAGRFVVVTTQDAYCFFTDAIIGSHIHCSGDYATREEADDAAGMIAHESCGDCGIYVLPSVHQPYDGPAYEDDGSIPF